jgi:hypothetical protein
MAKFRKKPIVIDAVQWNCEQSQLDLINGWWAASGNTQPFTLNPSKTLSIPTLEGVVLAVPGDYVIRGVKGELYPCKSDIFELTYEKVEEE